MHSERSIFATMPTVQFVEHLQKYGIAPSTSELNSTPLRGVTMSESIAISILEVTGQRFGESINGETSAK